MNNISPSKPSYFFGYWRPWNENANMFDSYLDYAKDVSLARYGAEVVGQYINQASKVQVEAINKLGQAMGQGMNVLSKQMSEINQNLQFLNRNMDLQIEQQKLTNLLLENIAELLRVPDVEKQRQHCIELGIKFLVKAQQDPDLYDDALEELLKAEALMRQDYFVLHRIGLIYLSTQKHINPEKALDYFIRAAKYASVETDEEILEYFNSLSINYYYEEKLNILSTEKRNELHNELTYFIVSTDDLYPKFKNKYKYRYKEFDFDSNYRLLVFEKRDEKKKVYFSDFIVDPNEDDDIKKEILDCQNDFDNILKKYEIEFPFYGFDLPINASASESYEKAAFAAYVLGRFDEAESYQNKALKFNSTKKNRFLLTKYQVRNGNVTEAVENLDLVIDDDPSFALAIFRELDLISEIEVVKLLEQKNEKIDKDINQLKLKWENLNSAESQKVIGNLNDLLLKSYEEKVNTYNKYVNDANLIVTNNSKIEVEIDSMISKINDIVFTTFDSLKLKEIVQELQEAKKMKVEEMKEKFHFLTGQIEKDKLQIGSHYAGGIVFKIDDSGKQGLVCTEKSLGKAVWAAGYQSIGAGYLPSRHDFNTSDNGKDNTEKIIELASWYKTETGFFDKKINVKTAANLCAECRLGGFDDWFLPSLSEAFHLKRFLNEQKSKIDSLEEIYWTSSKIPSDGSNRFSGQGFKLNDPSDGWRECSLGQMNSVLAIRAFKVKENTIETVIVNDNDGHNEKKDSKTSSIASNIDEFMAQLLNLNEIQSGLILDKNQTIDRLNNGFLRWRNNYVIEDEILFGLSSNTLDKNMSNIFTTKGIYYKQSGDKPKYINYNESLNFIFKKGGLFGFNGLIDSSTNFKIELVAMSPEKQKDQIIIKTIVNFINFMKGI